MRKSSTALLAALFLTTLVAASPALAGSLTFDGTSATWHSTQCPKPMPPASIYGANADTSGEDMNTLMTEHNAYVDVAQTYMNCISAEAARDQSMVDQAIAASAQKEIADTQASVDLSAQAVQKRQND